MVLYGKKILLIAPTFFMYEKAIKEGLENMGAIVDYFDERPANDFYTKALIRINKRLIKKNIDRYYHTIFTEVSERHYDYVFVVNIEAMPIAFLHAIRGRNRNSVFILYAWDSIQNKKGLSDFLPLFDFVFSFDSEDCLSSEHKVYFRPLFFLNEFESIVQKDSFKYDLSFVGTAHSDRYSIIQQLRNQAESYGFNNYWYLFLQDKKLFLYNKLTNPSFAKAHLSDFHYKPLGRKALLDIISDSQIVIDIHHPKQTGLTMRTIETLGARRKLITTNHYVKKYDFYDERNILVINREKPMLDIDFLKMPYAPLDEYIYQKYSLRGWLDEIFSIVMK